MSMLCSLHATYGLLWLGRCNVVQPCLVVIVCCACVAVADALLVLLHLLITKAREMPPGPRLQAGTVYIFVMTCLKPPTISTSWGCDDI
jgi:hypothetical protein